MALREGAYASFYTPYIHLVKKSCNIDKCICGCIDISCILALQIVRHQFWYIEDKSEANKVVSDFWRCCHTGRVILQQWDQSKLIIVEKEYTRHISIPACKVAHVCQVQQILNIRSLVQKKFVVLRVVSGIGIKFVAKHAKPSKTVIEGKIKPTIDISISA